MTKTKKKIDRRRVDDWASIDGAAAEIVYEGQTIARGLIDAVTEDGSIIWMQDDTFRRRLYEKSESYEVWVSSEHAALNYKVSRAAS